MRIPILCCVAGLALQCALFAFGQQPPPAPVATTANESGLEFTFALHSGQAPSRFLLQMDQKGYVTGISVFDPGKSEPRQTVTSCGGTDETFDEMNHELEAHETVLRHADLNFDGFEDLELMYMYVPHLGKELYCIYLWDPKTERFVYSKDLTEIGTNLQAHPEDETLTTHEDWMFGPWQDSTYRWIGGKPVMVEQVSFLGGWGDSADPCGFTYTCSKRISGKMMDTLKRKICNQEEMDDLPACPIAPKIGTRKAAPKRK